MKAAPLVLLSACAALGCAAAGRAARPLVAANDDARAFRAVESAESWGARLAAVQRYLERHPGGAYATDVREIWAREEPRFFERASATREGARGYLADLPRGPHASAALSLLVAFDAKVDDFETYKWLKAARSTEKMLSEAAAERQAADEWLSSALAELLKDETWSRAFEEAAGLVVVLRGARPGTWGGVPTTRDVRFAYAVPSPEGLVRRMLEARLAVRVEGGVARAAILEGSGLFLAWAEIMALRPLEPARTEDRAFAAARVRERLAGMLEGRFPEGACAGDGELGDFMARRCGGRQVRVVMGAGAGEPDRLELSAAP